MVLIGDIVVYVQDDADVEGRGGSSVRRRRLQSAVLLDERVLF